MDIHGVIPPDQFPPMRQQPSYARIMACLNSLRASKTDSLQDDNEDGWTDGDDVWDCATPRDEIEASLAANSLYVQRYANAISRYLNSIIMSDLGWLPSEDDRESLYTVASRRIAERCGRTAMGDITRRWPLVVDDDDDDDDDGNVPPQRKKVNLIIKEPALTGDSLGFKTWGTSYAMAQMLPALIKTPGLCHLEQPIRQEGLPVLELGAGTGLLGLAAAVLWRANVVLTDLATITPNLAANVQRNARSIAARNGADGKGGHARARAGVLQWGASRDDHDPETTGVDVIDPDLFPQDHMFPLILVADPIYDEEHPALLASAIDANLALEDDGGNAGGRLAPRAVVMVPLRDKKTEDMAAMFVAAMADRRLIPIDEGGISGQDSDWASGGGKGVGAGSDFTCSWWIFHRQ